MKTLVFTAIALAVVGCSTEQSYNAVNGWQKNECYKRVDSADREKCLKHADTDYDDYRKQTETP